MSIGADVVHASILVIATWAIESAVLRLVMGKRFGRKSAIDLFWINVLTNPAANYAYGNLAWNWWAVEAVVTTVEIWPIALSLRVSFLRAIMLSLLANGVSASVGRIFELIGG